MRTKVSRQALAAIVALAASSPAAASAGALVDIQFCNNFGQTIYVAIAYPQTTGHWVSRGWMSVSNGECGFFDSALHVPIFYIRAETAWHRVNRRRRERESWGGKGADDRWFAVVEDSSGSFNYYQAETKFSGVPNEPFFKFFAGSQLTLDGNSTATVTFKADGSTSSSIGTAKEEKTDPRSSN